MLLGRKLQYVHFHSLEHKVLIQNLYLGIEDIHHIQIKKSTLKGFVVRTRA